MLNALYPKLEALNIRRIGFDLDGTLYDEFDFIDQAYSEIALRNDHVLGDRLAAVSWMKRRWLEMGSSYNRIFDEAYENFGNRMSQKMNFVEGALDIYRGFFPILELPARTRFLLSKLKNDYELFLVTDGNPLLQRRKFGALGLGEWFLEQDCVFTGDYGADWHKPSIHCLEKVLIGASPSQCFFFGDRGVDEEFAKASGMNFARVYNMVPV